MFIYLKTWNLHSEHLSFYTQQDHSLKKPAQSFSQQMFSVRSFPVLNKQNMLVINFFVFL